MPPSPAAAPYVPLRVFSCYTMLEGAIEPKALAKRARLLGMPAAAIADRNGLYGAMAFSGACKDAGVQPIVAALLAVARPAALGGAAAGKPPVIDWLALYAQDAEGYDNLCVMVSTAHLGRPAHEEPHVPLDWLEGRTAGLIALTGAARAGWRGCWRAGRVPMRRAMPIGWRRCSPRGCTSSFRGAAMPSSSRPKTR